MFSVLLYVLWIVPPILEGVISYCMVIRRLYRDYPLFSAYTLEQILRFGVLFYLFHYGTRNQYSYAFFTLEVVDALLQLGVICELFVHTFRPYEGIRELGAIVLRWGGVILLLIAVVVAASSGGSDADKLLAGLFALEQSLQIVMGGLLLLLFTLSSALGLSWRQPGLGIALGFGIVASVNLVTFTLRLELGMNSHQILSLISNAGYACGVLVWLIALYTRKPVHKFEHQIRGWDVESWNRALLDLLRRSMALSIR